MTQGTRGSRSGRRTAHAAFGFAPLALIAACVALWACALLSAGPAGAAGIQVTQCTGDPSQQSCDKAPTTVQPAKPAPRPAPKPAAPAPKRTPAEVHDYSLTNGKGKVQTPDGRKKADTLKVSVSPSVNAPPARPKSKPPPPPAPGVAAPVSTTGGVPASGIASPFSLVSADQALSQFEIPPFLVPIYLAAGRTYGIPWNVLASINRIETDFGRNLSVSSAGALGWMQFMPGTWKSYGVDASGDGVADPYNPVDAVYAAARYLRASGGATDLRKAIFSYNHANWYVDEVLKNASVYGSLPGGLVAETGSLAYGRFPVVGAVRYSDDFHARRPAGWGPGGLLLHGRGGTRAVATQEVRVESLTLDRSLAATLQRGGSLRRLGSAPLSPPAASMATVLRPLQPALAAAGALAAPAGAGGIPRAALGILGVAVAATTSSAPVVAGRSAGGLPPGYEASRQPGIGVVVADGVGNRYLYRGLDAIAGQVRPGQRLHGGDPVGTVAANGILDFAVVAANGAPVDPRPLVDGYRLQEAANFYHAVAPFGANPFVPDGQQLTGPGGAPISGSDRALAQRALSDPGLDIYACGRQDIEQGKIDRRVLGALLFLRHNGFKLSISALKCGHSFYTSAGGISAHSFGAAVDIWAFNGEAVIGHQGPGTNIDRAIKLLMHLPGSTQPAQLISLESLGGPSFALSDHADHLHIGYSFTPALGLGGTGRALGKVSFPGSTGGAGLAGLAPGKATRSQEQQLSRELGKIVSPHVLRRLGPGAIKVEGEHAPAKHGAAGGLTLQPAGAGAQLSAIAAPADGARGQAFAAGVVDGAGHRGWAKSQTVILTFRAGAWRVLGPPRDARGRIANPNLRALAATAGGDGYAVGDRGAIVSFTGTGAPRVLPSPTRGRLIAIAVRDGRGGLEGTAVGAGGTVVRLAGDRASAHGAGSGRPQLTSVALAGDGSALITAASDTGPSLLRDDGRSARPVATAFRLPAGSRVELSQVATRGGQVWVAGAVNDDAGAWGHLPFVARQSGAGWRTYCAAGPQAAAVWELGARTPSVCDGTVGAGTGARGPVRALALTAQGAVAATSAGLELGGKDFRPVAPPDSTGTGPGPTAVQQLALSPQGDGWALDGAGRVARVLDGRGRASTEPDGAVFRLPAANPGRSAPVAVALGGDRALALSGGRLSTLTGSAFRPGRGPGVGVRAVAVAPGGEAWAIADSGQLLGYRDGRWSLPGDAQSKLRSLLDMTRALGDGSVAASPDRPLTAGFNALAFRAPGDGYAVGGGGLIAHFNGDGWTSERAPTDRTLVGVAAGRDGAVAVGEHGTLLERRDGHWAPVAQALGLVGAADLTAVTALRDGTVVAAAGGTTIVRDHGKWRAAPIAPAGGTIQRLAAYRDRGHQLHVLATVQGVGGAALLDGDSAGWRPVSVPAGLRLTDVHVDERARALWLGGVDGHAPVVAQVALPAGAGAGPVPPATAQPAGLMGLASGTAPLPPAPSAAPGSLGGPVAGNPFPGNGT